MKTRQSLATEFSDEMIEVVCEGYYEQIRFKSNLEQKKELMIHLPSIAKDYGANKALPDSIYKECVKLVMNKFSHLSLFELREAYRQFSAGQTQAKGAEMYRGEFNAANLGRVLGAYNKKRKVILSNYLRIMKQAQETVKDKKKKKDLQERFDQEFLKLIEEGKSKYTYWLQIPYFWFRACWKRGLIELNEDEIKHYKELARIAFEKMNTEEDPEKLGEILAAMESQMNIFAAKIALWEKVLEHQISKETLFEKLEE